MKQSASARLGELLSRIEETVTNDIVELHRAVCEHQFLGFIIGGEQPSHYAESPRLWNRYFEAAGVDGRFLPLDVPEAGGAGDLLLRLAEQPEVLDITVTNPYKKAAAERLIAFARSRRTGRPFMLQIEEAVRLTGAMNHLVVAAANNGEVQDGGACDSVRRSALNTDGIGMVRAILAHTPLQGRSMIVVGGGGAATSIAFEAVLSGAEVAVTSAFEGETEALIGLLHSLRASGPKARSFELSALADHLAGCDILVDAVSAGFPIDAVRSADLTSNVVIAETKYGAMADLRELADSRGLRYVDGWDMLFEQFREAVERVRPVMRVSERLHLEAVEEVARSCRPTGRK